jgi:hypothetical protein
VEKTAGSENGVKKVTLGKYPPFFNGVLMGVGCPWQGRGAKWLPPEVPRAENAATGKTGFMIFMV